MKGCVGAVLVAVLVSIAAAPAAAAVHTGGGADTSGDGTGGAARDVTNVTASYDDATGAIAFQVTFAAAPTAGSDSFVTALVGTHQSGGGCSYPAGGVGGNASGGVVVWLRDDGSGIVAQGSDGTRSLSGASLTLAATAPALAARPWDCAVVTLSQPGNSAVTYDTAGPFDLTAPPAPPAQPAPAPTPTPTPQPKPAPKRAQLAVSVTGIPTTIRRNRWMRLKVAVANPGSAAARKVKLAVGTARGLSARPRTKTFALIKAGKRTSATVRVRLTHRARRTTKVGVKATASGKLIARQTLALRIGSPPKSPSKGKGGGLSGRYFWRTVTRVDYAWDNRGIVFVDDRWAYRGIPKGGLPTCTSVTAGVDAKGEPTDGCLRYTYDASAGTVTVGGEQGRFDKATGKLTLGSDDYDPLAIPAPATRLDVSLVNRGFSGFCGLIVGCTTWTDYLTLRPDGQFALSSQSVASMGGSGVPFTYGWSAPPDQHGTYEIQAGGRIRLAFADGSTSVRTIGIGIGAGGKPDAAGTGLLLDDINYYKDDA